MGVRSRKLIGTVVLLAFLGAYALVIASIGAGRIAVRQRGQDVRLRLLDRFDDK